MREYPVKAALFDVDGIVIEARSRFFSERLSEEHGIPLASVQEFFLNDFKQCSFGKADLKDKIAPYLIEWNWKGTVDGLLEYWFKSESTKDEAVLAIIRELRERGIKCYIATRQEKYRMQYLLDVLGLKNEFDGTFSTCDIGYDKWQPEFFEHALTEIGLRPEEVLFFDDTQKNVDAANGMGINAYFYDSIDTLRRTTEPLLS